MILEKREPLREQDEHSGDCRVDIENIFMPWRDLVKSAALLLLMVIVVVQSWGGFYHSVGVTDVCSGGFARV